MKIIHYSQIKIISKALLLTLIMEIIISKPLFSATQYTENPICRNIRLYGSIDDLISTTRVHISLINSPDEFGRYPLHYAAQSRSISLIKMLIENGANINCLDADQNTPLFYTFNPASLLYPEDLQIAQLLIQNGVNINAVNKEGQTFLHKIIFYNNKVFFDLLIKNGARQSIADKDCKIALEYNY